MHSDAKFWDKISTKYAPKPVPNEEIHAQNSAISRRFMAPQSTVMEFGCGTGTTALKHAKDVAQIIAYDFSPAMIAIASANKLTRRIFIFAWPQWKVSNLVQNNKMSSWDIAYYT